VWNLGYAVSSVSDSNNIEIPNCKLSCSLNSVVNGIVIHEEEQT
jgi:hypothetical protein